MESITMKLLWVLIYVVCIAFMLILSPRHKNKSLDLMVIATVVIATSGFVLAINPIVRTAFWILAVVPFFLEIKKIANATRIFLFCQTLSIVFFVIGMLVTTGGVEPSVAAFCFILAAWTRQCFFPFHHGIKQIFQWGRKAQAITFATSQTGIWALILMPGMPETLSLLKPFMLPMIYFVMAFAAMLCWREKDTRLILAHLARFLPLAGALFLVDGAFSGRTLYILISNVIFITAIGCCLWLLNSRVGSCRLDQYHGYAACFPKLSGVFLLFTFGLLGAPGTMFFVAEDFLVQAVEKNGVRHEMVVLLLLALIGLSLFRAYARLFLGKLPEKIPVGDLKPREALAFAGLILGLIGFGLAPHLFTGP